MKVFVDTSAWFAYLVPQDLHHLAALQWIHKNRKPLVTTDYIIDETQTLLLYRVNAQTAVRMGQLFFRHQIDYITSEYVVKEWETFDKYQDKNWSFTN